MANSLETYATTTTTTTTKSSKVNALHVEDNLELGIVHPHHQPLSRHPDADQSLACYNDPEPLLCEALDWRGRPATTKHGGRKTSFFILANQGLWNVAFLAVATSLVLYFGRVLHMSNEEAANNCTNWFGTMWLLTLLGGFLGDSYLGRFWTCVLFQAIHVLGLLMLGIIVSVDSLHLVAGATTSLGQSLFFVAIYIIALGTGGYLPAFQALGADQFDSEADKTSFFGWLFFFTNIGAVVANTVVVYMENEGHWALGYWVATAAGALASLVFALGVPTYRQYRTGGNPFTRVAQVLAAMSKKWHVRVPEDGRKLHEVTEKELVRQGSRKMARTPWLRFLDKAAVKLDQDEPPWQLCSVTQVEEVKCLVRMVPIWLCAIPFSAVFSQINTLFIEQAAMMDTSLGGGSGFQMPPASISVVNVVAIFVCTVAYPWTVVPLARRVTGRKEGMTHLQRLGVGQVVTALAMAVAAMVETRRLEEAARGRRMGVMWLAPQEIVLGAAQVLAVVGAMDFFYTEAPHAMRGLVSALSLANLALGSYASTFLVSLTMTVTTRGGRSPGWIPPDLDRGHVDYFYWFLCCITIANTAVYALAAFCFARTSSSSKGARATHKPTS